MEKIKKISVVIATYNGEKYLREQLDSILHQTYPVYELIIQDDCSTDTTVDIIKEYLKRFANIKLFVNDINLGFNKNFWSALKKARGSYIAIADQDDIWMPNKIELLVNNIGDNLLAYTDSLPFTGDILPSLSLENVNVTSNLAGIRFISLQSGVLGHDCLIRKELVEKIPQVLQEYFVYDFALALVARSEQRIIHLPKYATYFRRHDSANSNLLQHYKGGVMGYIDCFRCLSPKNRLEISVRYKHMLPYLTVESDSIYKYALLLSSGKILDLFKAGLITYRMRKDLKDDADDLLNRIRTFFVPLFLYAKWRYIRKLWGTVIYKS